MLHGEGPEDASGDRASAEVVTIAAVQLDSDGGMVFFLQVSCVEFCSLWPVGDAGPDSEPPEPHTSWASSPGDPETSALV